MAKVEIYTSPFCGYCHMAKNLLSKKGVAFEEVNIFMVAGARNEMMKRSGGHHTVPQIFIDDNAIGGCDELHDLERHGKLNAMLTA